MILPLPDETLHSLIIRNAMVDTGSLRQKELGWVISYHGYWNNYPKVSTNNLLAEYPKVSTNNLLAEYPKNLIYEYILNRLPAVGCFCEPSYLDLTSIYKNLFNSDSFFNDKFVIDNCNIWQPSVSYCPECFKDQIFQYGVCYFKCSWYDSLNCEVHNTELSVIKRKFRANKLNNIYSELYRAMTVL
ncbi:hypothetical protein [Pseudoalteromonas sp. MMG012]|uniref:hypothetical protein n=1 Tax=Pseudoalteromonas sp. MMG012 TaxID=2822686 RepID=UPI001B3A336E|nr:hypothetical protein [Pseudoalteromonas sp. MMG012]MBQ4848532.1 hypothetical protein [Pseudoalteromonas sp. MMG012]